MTNETTPSATHAAGSLDAVVADLVASLPAMHAAQVPGNAEYEFAVRLVDAYFDRGEDASFPALDDLWLPFVSFGARDSHHLLGLDELILFSFYAHNSAGYRTAWDVGANIGAHTVMLARNGCEVTAFEPDPEHFARLREFCERNGVEATLRNQAMADSTRTDRFVRVCGNTTSSHIKGLKEPYGELEEFEVECVGFADAGEPPDLLKLDVEGAEAQIVGTIEPAVWESMDAILEVHTEQAATVLWERLDSLGLNVFAQLAGWEPIDSADEMPFGPIGGHLFVSRRPEMPWAA